MMTDAHRTLLAWLGEREGASLATAATALGLALAGAEHLTAALVGGALLARMPVQ